MANLYIIGGANGSGKTTVAKEILPYYLTVYEYVNADEIAKGLSPFRPENVAIQAGKLMLKRLAYLVKNNIDFAFESTLSGLNYVKFLEKCRRQNYQINLIYFWLENPQLAIQRVQQRVKSGGHNIPENIIIRRYYRGQKNLSKFYLPLSDTWIIYNNSQLPTTLVAEKTLSEPRIVYDERVYSQIMGENHE